MFATKSQFLFFIHLLFGIDSLVLLLKKKNVWVSPPLRFGEKKKRGSRSAPAQDDEKKKVVSSSYLRVLRELVVATHDGGGGVSPRSSVSRHRTRTRVSKRAFVSLVYKIGNVCVGRLLWCPLPSTHTHARAPLFDERAASSSRFFSSSSSSLPIARHPRHKGAATRERAPPRTNVVTTQAQDDGSPFLLFCLGFVIFRVFPKIGTFFIH